MIHPEEVAKSLWCPFSRSPGVLTTHTVDNREYTVAHDHMSAVNRNSDGRASPSSLCLGSGCMMWRWHVVAGVPNTDGHGYCGLAGVVG